MRMKKLKDKKIVFIVIVVIVIVILVIKKVGGDAWFPEGWSAKSCILEGLDLGQHTGKASPDGST